jgi:hypothetical protein
MTYSDWYVANLYSKLTAGGTLEVVDYLVGQINNPTVEGLQEYVGQVKSVGPCDTCGDYFPADATKVTLDEEFVCPKCRKTLP